MSPKQRRALLLVILTGAVLRFWSIGFGLPQRYRPDEEILVEHALGFHSGDLNPHFFLYPTFYIYVLSGVYWIYARVGTALGSFGRAGFHLYLEHTWYASLYLIGRCTTALLGVATLYTTFRLGVLAFGVTEGLLAAGFLAVNFLHVRDSHFLTTDAPMAFMTTLALLAILTVARRGRLRHYLLAGALIGLTASTKYPGFALATSLAAAHVIRLVRQRRWPWHPEEVGLLAYAGLAIVVAFLAGSPFVVLDGKTFMEAVQYQSFWVRYGLPGISAPYGREWLVGFALPHAVGVGTAYVLLAATAFAFVDFWRKDARGHGLILAVFAVSLAGSYLSGMLLYLRYFVPLMPVAALLISRFVLEVARVALPQRYATAAATALIAVASLDPLSRAVSLDRLLAQKDTRTFAREWIVANLPAGAHIGTCSTYFYGKPQLQRDGHYEDFEQIVGGEVGGKLHNVWIVVDEHPIRMFSPPPTPEIAQFIETRGTLVAEFDPFVPGTPTPPYEPPDAFYVPLAQFSSVMRPGPRIRIYQIDANTGGPHPFGEASSPMGGCGPQDADRSTGENPVEPHGTRWWSPYAAVG